MYPRRMKRNSKFHHPKILSYLGCFGVLAKDIDMNKKGCHVNRPTFCQPRTALVCYGCRMDKLYFVQGDARRGKSIVCHDLPSVAPSLVISWSTYGFVPRLQTSL
jgi:hypothetical protein